jgi:hypothetical protein
MSRTHLEMLANFLLVLYLVTHGVSVPREGQADLVSSFYHSILAWIKGQASWLSAFARIGGRPIQA